jgi:hypothetical protein
MPQHLFEAVSRMMELQRSGDGPNRTYKRVEPLTAASRAGSKASDSQGNVRIELLQETDPVLDQSILDERARDGALRVALDVATALIGTASLWTGVGLMIGRPESTLGVLMLVVPPLMFASAGWFLLGMVRWALSELFFVSHLMSFTASGTFETNASGLVTTHVAPEVYTARVLSSTFVGAWSSRGAGPRLILSFEKAEHLLDALMGEVESYLNGQAVKKIGKQGAIQRIGEATGKAAANQILASGPLSIRGLLPRRKP